MTEVPGGYDAITDLKIVDHLFHLTQEVQQGNLLEDGAVQPLESVDQVATIIPLDLELESLVDEAVDD